MHSISLYLIVFTFVTTLNVAYNQVVENVNWDYLQFVLAWPPSYCSTHECQLNPNLRNFTIRGLWATNNPYNPLENCTGERFHFQNLSDIQSDLSNAWPDLKRSTCAKGRWKKEWELHGRCTVDDPSIATQHGYFEVSLMQKYKYDVLKVLEFQGIKPDSSALIGELQFTDILQQAYNHRVSLRCRRFPGLKPTHMYIKQGVKHVRQPLKQESNHEVQIQQLDAVILCLTPQLQLRDCPYDFGVKNRCPSGFVFAQFNHSFDSNEIPDSGDC
uniref:SJCHGC06710 protein n=1 Tax=Schistosoma japonicum TaxID=6182 RepID=Q5D8W0_SCHJA|nr:SJCHGC06710 protein [Schistosoma japonicum]